MEEMEDEEDEGEEEEEKERWESGWWMFGRKSGVGVSGLVGWLVGGGWGGVEIEREGEGEIRGSIDTTGVLEWRGGGEGGCELEGGIEGSCGRYQSWVGGEGGRTNHVGSEG